MQHTLEITSLAYGGDGIGRIEGQVCFVPWGLPGDVLRVQITRRARQVLWADILEVVTPSQHRIEDPPCPNFGRCGVCTWIHFAYPAQAEWKQRLVAETLQRIGGVEIDLAWREMPELRLGYRTRAEFHGIDGKLGFYARGTHDVIDTPFCPLCHPRLNAALERLRALQPRGEITVTINPEGEETLIWLKRSQRKVQQAFPLTGHPRDGQRPAQFLFDGRPIVNGGFAQAGLQLNRMLVEVAREYIGTPASLLDCYCGNGNFSLDLVSAAQVAGIDHHPETIAAARQVSGGDYRRGDERAMAEAMRAQSWEVILLDPPRTGAKGIVRDLSQARAGRIVYVSCDAPTLARDVRHLTGAGWRLTRATALDMFPNTAHIETVCMLER